MNDTKTKELKRQRLIKGPNNAIASTDHVREVIEQ